MLVGRLGCAGCMQPFHVLTDPKTSPSRSPKLSDIVGTVVTVHALSGATSTHGPSTCHPGQAGHQVWETMTLGKRRWPYWLSQSSGDSAGVMYGAMGI